MNKAERQFVIYGAGNQGKWCLDLLEWRKIDDRVWGFCDRRYKELKQLKGKRVVSYEEAKILGIPFLISCADKKTADDILQVVKNDGNNGYLFSEFYKVLQEEESVFLREVKYFKELDLEKVIELACGRGRHVPFYIKQAGEITLVDILEENIAICRERFKESRNIIYYKNNGYNFEKLPSDSYTSVFSYDSMVHFELMDVYAYLKDMYCVLKAGGKALLHHSNYTADYAADFLHSPHSRCFMSRDIFAYLAHRAGFKILSQDVIDWYGSKDLDCITLLQK